MPFLPPEVIFHIQFKEDPVWYDHADTRVIRACIHAWPYGPVLGVGHWVFISVAMVRHFDR